MVEGRRVPVSIVCVYNEASVLATCLERSIDLGRPVAPEVDFIAVDNRENAFRTAGSALNDGARRARHPVIAFVHQDVFLHSLPALEVAGAKLLSDSGIGMLGAVGTAASGRVFGTMRDRVVMIGDASDTATPVDSVDEVLFLLRREDVLEDPLSEDPDLAWHAYAVEYAAREASRGRRVLTADMAVTHNSMTTNLKGLGEAHHRVAELYPDIVPLQTTCGVVRAAADRSTLRSLARRRRGLETWLGESLAARRLSKETAMDYSDIVLGDVRFGIDDALDFLEATDLDVVNVESGTAHDWDVTDLTRRDRNFTARQMEPRDLPAVIGTRQPGQAVLLTGRIGDWISASAFQVGPADRLLGITRDAGAWLLLADRAHRAASLWSSWRHRGLGASRSPKTKSRALGSEGAFCL